MTSFMKIRQVAHYVPEQVVSNDDLSKIMDTNDDWISSRTGIRRRHISRNQSTSQLAIEVGKQLLQKADLPAEELDFIIVATITPDSLMPSTAALVQAALGASRAFAYDLTAACSGFVFALSQAEKLLSAGCYKKGMVIGAETLSKTLDWTDRSTAVLFGDGAGGVLVEASNQEGLWAETLVTDGTRGSYLTAGIKELSSPFSERADDQPYLQMDGRAVFDFTIRDVTKTIAKVIDDSHMTVEDIDYFLLHQANIRILDKMAKKLGVAREKFLANMMEYGNTSAASIPILLSECVAEGKLTLGQGQTILMCGFGGGLTIGALILTL